MKARKHGSSLFQEPSLTCRKDCVYITIPLALTSCIASQSECREMAKPFSICTRLLLVCASAVVVFSIGVCGSPQVPAFFVFGDSIVDDGNNNYLNSIAKANYLPYGVDFDGGPSGRFCNGKTIIDFLGSRLSVLFTLLSIFSFKSIMMHK